MPKRLARKPSTASLTPAAATSRNENRIWFDAIAQTTTGTSRMRASVIRLGILKRLAPALPKQISPARPLAKRRCGQPEPAHCLAGPSVLGQIHEREAKWPDLGASRRQYRCRQPDGGPDQAA